MAIRTVITLTALALSTLVVTATAPAQSIPAGLGNRWQPTFAAEFDTGPSDLVGWTYDLGTGQDGWGNFESQSYTNGPANVSVAGGALRLTAIGTPGPGGSTAYTSGRIRSTALFSQAYGLFEFRAKLPAGQGLWPAIWMMPRDSVYGGWPRSGEIDVMESTGQNTGRVEGTLHSGTSPGTVARLTGAYQPAGFDTTEFHTYALKWTPGPSPTQPATFQWFVDGNLYQTRTGGWVVPAGAANRDAPFDQPYYLIMNLAVGGTYTGFVTPGPGTYEMQVDYARAYQFAPIPEPAATMAMIGFVGCLAIRPRRSGRETVPRG